MTTETVSLEQFITDNRVTMTAERTDSNPAMDDSANMDHWRVTLRCRRRQMTTVFSMGYGHNGAEPKTAEVLDCLASDANGYDNAQSFEDWAGDYGFDTDSRKAERTYKAMAKSADKIRRLLGDDAYTLLTNGSVERL